MTEGVEAELKFQLAEGESERLGVGAGLEDCRVDPPVAADLVSVYFDTADLRLRGAGLSLRVRETAGAFEQTLKSAAGEWSGLASRREVSSPVDGPLPDLSALRDGELVRDVVDLVGGEPLVPAFTVAVRRNLTMVETAGGDRVEVAVDTGEIRAADRRETVCEAEFELKSGDVAALFPVARAVLADVPVRPSTESKADRGFRLLADRPAGAPRKAGSVAIANEANVEEALEAVLRSATAQVLANVAAVRAGDDPEGPHQLRVGLRRLRTALKVFDKVVDGPEAQRLGREARDLGRAVGEVRDLDVLADETIAACADVVDTAGLARLVDEARAERRAALRATLDEAPAGAFLMDLVAFVEGRAWRRAGDPHRTRALAAAAAPFARKAVARRWRKAAEKGRDVDALSADGRHDLRKSMKTLRYAMEFFAPLLGRKDAKSMTRRTKAALEVLGYVNDVRSARSLLPLLDAAPVRDAKARRALERSAGFVLGWHENAAARTWAESRSLAHLRRKA